ncbi:MAG: protein kinase [Pseudomonadota bacterium]
MVEAFVAQGGLARVYRARHLQLGTLHALKVLELPTPDLRARLLREGRAQGGLQHPNVVAVTDVVEVRGSPGLVMEYVDGPTLEGLLRRGRPPLDEAVRLGRQILRGVAAAHRVGLIHRDLKPSNVLIARGEEGPQAKVADFGLVKMILGDGSLDAPGGPRFRTRSGLPMGTPGFMAPEQIRDASRVDARADVFALGAVLYALLTGTRAFQGKDPVALFSATLDGRCRRPSEVAPAVPAALEAVIMAALAGDPEDRPRDAQALLQAWDAAAEPPPLPTAEPPAAPPRAGRRWRWALLAGAALGLAATGILLALPPGPGAPLGAAITRLTMPGTQLHPALSPDGREVIYSDGQDLYLQPVGGGLASSLTDGLEAAAMAPALSRDGAQLAFEAGGAIYLAGPRGQQPRLVVEGGHAPAFSPDGRTLAWTTRALGAAGETSSSDSELWLVDLDSGARRAVLRSLNPLSPSFSPDGRFLAFTGGEGGWVAPAVWAVPAAGGEPWKLTPGEGHSPAWDPSGEAVWHLARRGDDTALLRLPVDRASGRAAGAAAQVALIPSSRVWGLCIAAQAPRLAVTAAGAAADADLDLWLLDLR